MFLKLFCDIAKVEIIHKTNLNNLAKTNEEWKLKKLRILLYFLPPIAKWNKYVAIFWKNPENGKR